MRSAPGTADLEQLHLFRDRVLLHGGQPGDIAAGVRKAGHEPAANWIVECCYDDRDRRGRLLRRHRRCARPDDDDFRGKPHQFGGELGKPLHASLGPAALDFDVPIGITEGAQPLSECLPILGAVGGRSLGKNGDTMAFRRLRPENARQQRYPSGCEYETTPRHRRSCHSITSSARARIEGGMVRPNACAVFMLTTNSSLLACSTGRSAGLVPFRMRSTK